MKQYGWGGDGDETWEWGEGGNKLGYSVKLCTHFHRSAGSRPNIVELVVIFLWEIIAKNSFFNFSLRDISKYHSNQLPSCIGWNSKEAFNLTNQCDNFSNT